MSSLAGQTFAGYEIICELGKGGMDAVYKARQPMLNRCGDTQVSNLLPLGSLPLQELRCDFHPQRDAEALRNCPRSGYIGISTLARRGEGRGVPQLPRQEPHKVTI